jgi:myo-inositol-1(or 4)-monophosphatase
MPRSAVLNVMVQAARKAARGLVRDFGEIENLQVSRKGPADFVSAADRRAEQILFEELRRVRPGYGFVMEESGEVAGADPLHRWIVDPLDGTTNFLHGVPQFAISIALERDGVLVAGLILNPVSDELYLAERGRGASLNDRRLRVSSRTSLVESLIGCGVPFAGHGDAKRFAGEIARIQGEIAGIRRFGAASLDLAWVAAGRLDGFWERGLKVWDMAAGIVIVREAGGMVSDLDGGDGWATSGSILASNQLLHEDLLRRLSGPRA